MYALNRVQLIGYLTQAPEIRQTPNGQTVGDLNVMTHHTFTRSDGETQESKAFHSVVVWRGLADIAGRYLKQGSQVFISGRLQTDEWEDQEGHRRYKTRIVADEMILLDPRVPAAPLPAGSKLKGQLNRAEVIGNLTRDPELRQTPSGTSVASFGVATTFSWKSRTGEQQEKTEFHNIVAWGVLSQAAQEVLKKGRKVYVNGRVQTRSWETPEGVKRYTTEIIADELLALGTPSEEFGAPGIGAADQVQVKEVKMKEKAMAQADEEPSGAVPEIDYESKVKPEDLPF